MENFSTLLVGSAMLAGVAFLTWLIGLLMGFAAGRLAAGAGAKHKDVDELLARQRAAAPKTPSAQAVAASGASSVT